MDIDLDDLITEVRRIASENPNFVYNQMVCKYQVRGKPSCLIGQGLHAIGVDTAVLKAFDDREDSEIQTILVDELGFDVEDARIYWLSATQSAQDCQTPWGKAISQADFYYPQLIGANA